MYLSVPVTHRFRTETTSDPEEQLVLYRRASGSKRSGTSNTP